MLTDSWLPGILTQLYFSSLGMDMTRIRLVLHFDTSPLIITLFWILLFTLIKSAILVTKGLFVEFLHMLETQGYLEMDLFMKLMVLESTILDFIFPKLYVKTQKALLFHCEKVLHCRFGLLRMQFWLGTFLRARRITTSTLVYLPLCRFYSPFAGNSINSYFSYKVT